MLDCVCVFPMSVKLWYCFDFEKLRDFGLSTVVMCTAVLLSTKCGTCTESNTNLFMQQYKASVLCALVKPDWWNWSTAVTWILCDYSPLFFTGSRQNFILIWTLIFELGAEEKWQYIYIKIHQCPIYNLLQCSNYNGNALSLEESANIIFRFILNSSSFMFNLVIGCSFERAHCSPLAVALSTLRSVQTQTAPPLSCIE